MNLFELFVKIGVDDKASDKISNLSSKLGNGLKTAAKIGTAAVGAAAAGITALTTAAVNNYAEYEQLVGGVETLFKQSADVVQQYAANAYKTAGMSANEYMETVTSFSASLLQSLDGDTAAAAEKANLAITDMSDNANKMGTDMEMIQNAYNGFAKQNYTMLDNLKLGYGGTKEEMQRLLNDAEKLSGQKFDLSSYGDIVDAIHIVQTEMGITGTTAKEAASTISGSIASMKSAWSNLVTGIADENAEFGTLVNNFAESASTVLDNILPRIEESLYGVDALIYRMFPIIMERIPQIISDFLPRFVETSTMIVQSIIDGISQNQEMLFETIFGVITYLAESFITMLPQIVELGLNLIVSLANGIAGSLPELIPTIVDVVLQIVETLIDNVDMLVDAAIEIMIALADGLINALPKLIEKVPVIITKLIEAYANNAPKMIEAALKIILSLAEGLIKSIPQLIKSIPQIVTAIVNGFTSFMSQIKDIGKNIVKGLWEGIKSMATWVTDKVKGFFSGIVSGVKGLLGIKSPSKVFASIGGYMAEGLGEGWENEYGNIKKQIEGDMNFGTATVDFASSVAGRYNGAMQSSIGDLAASINQNATIVVQSVLDGKVIGETAYQYSKNRQRAYGVT